MERGYWLINGAEIEWCNARMANDYKRMSGRVCGLAPGHEGAHRSTYAISGERLKAAPRPH
jgi:hypothetical protein